jgi:hypothetical protein
MKKAPPALKRPTKVIPKKPITSGQGKTGVTTAEKVFRSKPGTSLMTKKPVSGSVPKGGSRTQAGPRPVGSGRSSTMRPSQQRTTTQQKPLKPGIGNIVKTGAALGTIAQGKKALDGRPSQAKTMAMPKPKPKVQGPPKPSTKTKAAPKTKGPRVVERTAISAGKNTGFGPNASIFPGSAAERKALMKMYGGTGKAAAKAAIAGTQGNLAAGQADYIAARNMRFKKTANNKNVGGTVGKKTKPITKTVNKYNTTKYDTPQKDAQYTGEKKIRIGKKLKPGMMSKKKAMDGFIKKPKQYKPTGKGTGKKKIIPRQYKGFSKLPEAVQNKMDPSLAAKFGEGGSIKSGCARQVRGFGAARKPKK